MTSKEKKGRFGKRKTRRVIFIIIPFVLILALAIIYTRRETPPEKRPDLPEVYPPVPQAEKKAEEKKVEETKKEEKKEPEKPSYPRLALIIDDGGYNTDKFKKMLGVGRPMTFAILPNTPHGKEAALMAHRAGCEVMLHLPMEPKEEEMYSLERDTVLTGMKPAEIQRILRHDLEQIPFVRGVNNHMGSKATEDPKVMQALMAALKKEKLYFIDSRTSPQSLGPEAARKAGVAFWQNDRFLDREENLEKIKKAARSAMRKAKKEGKAVAIGHPHPLTARAIRELIPELEKEGIRLVFASEVVG
jgi:polysaccharide deacetylase 2 family uncharacterized protein YibQ